MRCHSMELDNGCRACARFAKSVWFNALSTWSDFQAVEQVRDEMVEDGIEVDVVRFIVHMTRYATSFPTSRA